jgi:hypothetical protein
VLAVREEAVANFRQALQLDPDFVPAGEALARALLTVARSGLPNSKLQ